MLGNILGGNILKLWKLDVSKGVDSPKYNSPIFLSGFLKEEIYAYRHFERVDHLERIMRECTQEISNQIVGKAVTDFSGRDVK